MIFTYNEGSKSLLVREGDTELEISARASGLEVQVNRSDFKRMSSKNGSFLSFLFGRLEEEKEQEQEQVLEEEREDDSDQD